MERLVASTMGYILASNLATALNIWWNYYSLTTLGMDRLLSIFSTYKVIFNYHLAIPRSRELEKILNRPLTDLGIPVI